MAELTYDEISKLLKYDPETGKFYWLPRPAEMFDGEGFCGGAEAKAKTWNIRYAGKEAFTSFHNRGYIQACVLRHRYLAHRVAWLLATGSWPTDQIDHINGDRTDNRLSNLREVTNTENARNMSLSKRNKSGATGVFFLKHINKWWASIRVEGRNKNLGYFEDFEAACAARKAAEQEFGFHKNHGARLHKATKKPEPAGSIP